MSEYSKAVKYNYGEEESLKKFICSKSIQKDKSMCFYENTTFRVCVYKFITGRGGDKYYLMIEDISKGDEDEDFPVLFRSKNFNSPKQLEFHFHENEKEYIIVFGKHTFYLEFVFIQKSNKMITPVQIMLRYSQNEIDNARDYIKQIFYFGVFVFVVNYENDIIIYKFHDVAFYKIFIDHLNRRYPKNYEDNIVYIRKGDAEGFYILNKGNKNYLFNFRDIDFNYLYLNSNMLQGKDCYKEF
jgi:hypothetical protein